LVASGVISAVSDVSVTSVKRRVDVVLPVKQETKKGMLDFFYAITCADIS
jgi:hypothetical protein